MPDKAYINPLILKWARESAKVSLETAAAKFSSVTPERIAEWEEGNEEAYGYVRSFIPHG